MHRREFLRASLALVVIPLLRSLFRDPPANDVMVPPEWEVLIARAEAQAEDRYGQWIPLHDVW